MLVYEMSRKIWKKFFLYTTSFCDHNTKVVYTNSIEYYHCTQNSSSDSWSALQPRPTLYYTLNKN